MAGSSMNMGHNKYGETPPADHINCLAMSDMIVVPKMTKTMPSPRDFAVNP
jgi:hypothetical protein